MPPSRTKPHARTKVRNSRNLNPNRRPVVLEHWKHILSHFDWIDTIWGFIEDLGIKHRSAVVKICQAQFVPEPSSDTALGRVLNGLPDVEYFAPERGAKVLLPFRMVLYELFSPIISSPLNSAIILDLCRGLPVSALEIEVTRMSAWGKEISLMETDPGAPRVNWDVLFDRDCVNESIIPGLKPNRGMALTHILHLEAWRSEVTRKVHYPRMTFKNMSYSTRRDYEESSGNSLDSSTQPVFGQINYERYYFRTGILLGGSLELRQRWYVSGHKPRTYSAQGGTTYQTSKNLQGAFTSLVNHSEVTNHVTRVHPARVRLVYGNYLRVYDLATFTSNMDEQRNYVSRLSKFVSGWPFTYMDAREGLVTRDFGEVLYEYNEVCNQCPEMSYERLLKDMDGRMFRHNKASALGVFGNLMTCTAAHAGLVSQIVDLEDEVNIAGDDGAISSNPERDELLGYAIEAIGEDQPEKRFQSNEDGCICLKRPLTQEYETLNQHYRTIPPSMYSYLHHVWNYDDPRYRHFEDADFDGIRVICHEVCRFLRSIFIAQAALSAQEKRDALYMCKKIGDDMGLNQEGLVEGVLGSRYTWPAIQAMLNNSECWQFDPLEFVMIEKYPGGAEVQLREQRAFEVEGLLYAGAEFECNSSEHLVFLERLGLVEKEPLTQHLGPLDVNRFVFEKLHNTVPVVYRYLVLEDIPLHLNV